jgi:nucleoside-diphosphate-sugar epimerase
MGRRYRMTTSSNVLVVGAGGVLGREIVRILRAKGVDVVAAFRTRRAGLKQTLAGWGAKPLQLDIDDSDATRQALGEVDAAVFTPILTVSQSAAALLGAGQRAVFFSSNNVAIDPEAEVYARLAKAEEAVLKAAPGAVILRPTMIYGYPGDGNIRRLIRFVRCSPILPLPGNGAALQQPVYYRDLAKAAAQTIVDAALTARTYTVAGPEPTTTRALYEAVASAAGARPFIAPMPFAAFAPILRGAEATGLKLPVKAAQLARAARDKTPPPEAVLMLGNTSVDKGLAALTTALDDGQHGA